MAMTGLDTIEAQSMLEWILWSLLGKFAVLAAATILVLKAYIVHSKGIFVSKQTMEGKTVIITGANAGIGKETAKDLARRKARVILACRNLTLAKAAAEEIFQETKRLVQIRHLDLASFKSIRSFVNGIVETEHKVDVLINNAGMVSSAHDCLTEDGFEVCFQTNYLGPFLLTMLLLDSLKKGAPGRVVNLSSIMHHFGSAKDIENKVRGRYAWSHPLLVYSHTKMAMILFTRELASRLKDHGVTVNAVHPGLVRTTIATRSDPFTFLLSIFMFGFFGKTPREGAQTSIYAAVAPELSNVTGKYFLDCSQGYVSWRALDRTEGKRLFDATSKLVELVD